MDDLERDLARGHPEERTYRPPPFDAVRSRPTPIAPAGGIAAIRRDAPRLLALLAAVLGVVAIAVVARPLDARLDVGGAPAGAGRTASPAGSAGGGGKPQPSVQCETNAADCGWVADAVRQRLGGDVMSIEVRRFVPACVRASLCEDGSATPQRLIAVTRDALGYSAGFLCDATYSDAAAACLPAPAAEYAALATLVLTVEGAASQEVLLSGADGTTRRLTANPTARQALPAGAWRLAVPAGVCAAGCVPRVAGVIGAAGATAPPGWCTVELDAAAGVRLDVTVTAGRAGPCRIEVR